MKTILKRAIERGLANGKLRDELSELGNITLKSRADAEAVCWGLQQLGGRQSLAQDLCSLAALFQELDDSDSVAFELLQERGVPELLKLFDALNQAPKEEDADTLLFVLKILGLYGTTDGTLKIVEAARQPIQPDNFLWSVILGCFTAEHPEKDLLYSSLAHPLPVGFIAVALLDAANAVLVEGNSMPHPFDSPEGKRKLTDWLTSTDEEESDLAHSATAALPFIGNPERNSLIRLALNHAVVGVRIEAAWASAKLGRDDGWKRLAEYCRDVRTAQVAKRYLGELGREDLIPPEATDPGFTAMAEFAQWCAHPNELGRVPDELTIADHRELCWPPEREAKPLWLIKYTLRDPTGLKDVEEGCGLVGSVTFCFFSYQLAQRPPEDAYAAHCYWEMQHKGLIEESHVGEDPSAYASLVKQWPGPALEDPQISHIAELSPELDYPQRLVGLASVHLNGQAGWVILDGIRSEWYPSDEQPAESPGSVLLGIHVGRHLLGFVGKPDRKKYLAPAKPPRPAAELIAGYERLLAQARAAERKKRPRAFESFGPLDRHFEAYTLALMGAGRAAEVRDLVQLLAPYWNHPRGFSTLGTAAFKARHRDLAEEFFVKYRDQCTDYERGEEMALLAELWHGSGKQDQAKRLLLDCLARNAQASKDAELADIRQIEEWFQKQRRTFLRLFPADEALLSERAIPTSTLRPGAQTDLPKA